MATRLFSGQELSSLRRDASFRRQIEEGLVMEVELPTSSAGVGTQETETAALSGQRRQKPDPIAGGLKDRDPKKWFEVSWRSISLARQERARRGRKCEDDGDSKPSGQHSAGDSRNNRGVEGVQPQISSKASRERADSSTPGVGRGTNDTDDRGGERKKVGAVGDVRAFQETEASAMRQHARKREDQVLAGGAQNFYKSVRVCGACFRVSASLSPILFRRTLFPHVYSLLGWPGHFRLFHRAYEFIDNSSVLLMSID